MKAPGALPPKVLMGLCRANGQEGNFEAEAYEQLRWQLVNGEGKDRVLAWVKLHSIALGHPKCVDEAGHALRVESCAADLGISLITAQHHCTTLVAEGRIRLKKAQIWYRADVPENIPLAAPPVADATEDENCYVHDNFVGYVADSYWKQSAEKRAQIRATWDKFKLWRQKAFLEGLAGLRHEISRVEVNTLGALGLPKYIQPKTAAQNPRWFQLALMAEPDFVHDKGTEPVSTPLNTAVPGDVHDRASLLPNNSTQQVERTPPPSPTETGVSEVVMVSNRLSVSMTTATKILRNVRAVAPSLPALAVIHLAEEKLRRSPGSTNPIGLLLTKLAEEAVGPPLAKAIEAARREDERAAQAAENAAADVSKDRSDAERILADPEAAPFELEWANEVLAKGKGAGDAG